MNANYVTRVEYKTVWEGLGQIQHLDLFFPVFPEFTIWLTEGQKRASDYNQIYLLNPLLAGLVTRNPSLPNP